MNNNYLKTIVLSFTLFLGFNGIGQISTPMYTVSPFTGEMWTVDTTTWTELPGSVTLTSILGTVDGCNGLAVQPCTGDIYVIYKIGAIIGRLLGIVDPETGVITNIGNTGDNVAGICFGSETQLYAVTGDGATVPETLFKVNLGTAALTTFVPLGNGDDGENIAFNDDNGLIYHWSGIGGTTIMESIDTATGVVTPIILSGYAASEIFGSTYLGNNTFLLANISSEYVPIDISGVGQTPLGTSLDDLKGMCFPKAFVGHTNLNDTICDGDTIILYSIMADSYQWYEGGNPIGGETASSLNVVADGDYQVEATINGCVYLSNTVTIEVLNSPNVNINPSPNAYICMAGDSVLLVGSMGGMSQWYLNGISIGGATNDSLWVLTSGNYNMVKTNMNGCSDSAAVGTFVSFPPALSMNPADSVTFCTADSTIVNATAGATSYQWYLNGTPIAGATSSIYYVSAVGNYTVSAMFGNCQDSTATALVGVEEACGIGFEEDYFGELIVYPNPANFEITVEFESQGSVAEMQLVGLDGKIVYSELISTSKGKIITTIPLNDIAEGFYILRLSQNGRTTTNPIAVH